MDVARDPSHKRKRRMWMVAWSLLGCLALGVGTAALIRLPAAAPTVEWSVIWPGTVKRGPMIRQVHGNGTLTPIEVLFIPARNDGRVDKIFIRPGTPVKADSVILRLTNPELENEAVDTEYALKQEQAAFTNLRVQLQSQGFDKQAAAAQVNSDYRQAQLKADRDTKLSAAGLIPEVDLKLSTTQAAELKERDGIEQKRLGIIDQSVQAQLDAEKVKIEQLQAQHELKLQEVSQLNVRAGAAGVLVDLPVEVGQQISAGTVLAKVTQPSKLKASLKITETEAKDILIGQPASIDTHNGLIEGHVIRIDPAALNGSVMVDVGLEGELPQGARPDQSVDGTVELEHLSDVVYVDKPTNGNPNTTVTLFKISPDQKFGTKVPVKLGRTSVNTIEVLSGLNVGDQVVLSDMAQWDAHDRIRFNH